MIKIKLSQNEIDLLKYCYKEMQLETNYFVEDNHVIINENELENLDTMFNCILDTFLKVGLLDNYEPNQLGYELENLNEKINHEYVELNDVILQMKQSIKKDQK